MIIAFADEEGRRLAIGRHGGGEFARLALELRRLERAVRDDDRRAQPIEVALGTQSCLHLVCEFHVIRARREPRTGFKSYMPEHNSAPLMTSGGRSKSRPQSVTSATPARCAPEEWPLTWRRSCLPPSSAAFR